jgi:DUF917 family protein
LRLIGEDALEDIALGAAILGTGGGGDPYIGKLLAREAIRQHGPVELIDVDEVPPDALVVPTAMMGAPTVMVEKIPSGTDVDAAFRAYEEYAGRTIAYTMSAEAGGLNSVMPFLLAARKRIPMVDADMMGRAFPEIQMTLPTLFGIPATPMAMADEKGNVNVLQTIDNRWTERFARAIAIEMGCSAMIALYALPGDRLRECAVPGTLSLCEELGRLVRETRAAHGDAIGAVAERLRGHRVFTGKVVDVLRRTTTGFARAEVLLDGTGAHAGQRLLIHTQNEHLVALRDGEPVATTPDLIIVMDAESGAPITTEEIRYGFRVEVLATPCDPRWRSEAGIALAGPRYFGYDLDYVPVEELAGSGSGAQ